MGAQVPKQFLLLKGKPLLWYTLQTFLQTFPDIQVILVLPAAHIGEGEHLVQSLEHNNRITLVAGGATRFHSVQNGLGLVKEEAIVFVHDGVRCLVTADLLQRCYEQALVKGSAIPAVTATDSIRVVTHEGSVVADRNTIRIVQTPQTFKTTLLLPAFEQVYTEAFTDEATVVEAMGNPICLIEGEHTNIKITRPVDLLIAEKIVEERG